MGPWANWESDPRASEKRVPPITEPVSRAISLSAFGFTLLSTNRAGEWCLRMKSTKFVRSANPAWQWY